MDRTILHELSHATAQYVRPEINHSRAESLEALKRNEIKEEIIAELSAMHLAKMLNVKDLDRTHEAYIKSHYKNINYDHQIFNEALIESRKAVKFLIDPKTNLRSGYQVKPQMTVKEKSKPHHPCKDKFGAVKNKICNAFRHKKF